MLQLESSNYPHTLAQWLYILLATFLGGGGVGAWLTAWFRRRHGPAEVRKIHAEARQIEVRSDIDLGDSVLKLIKEVSTAKIEAERLRDERNHWELKSFDLQLEVKDLQSENAQMQTQARLDERQIKKMKALLDLKGISYSEADHL